MNKLYEGIEVYFTNVADKTFKITEVIGDQMSLVCRKTDAVFNIDIKAFENGLKLGIIKSIETLIDPIEQEEVKEKPSNYFSFDDM